MSGSLTNTHFGHTPVGGSSSQWGAKSVFPCLFHQDCSFSRLQEKFPLTVSNLFHTNHGVFALRRPGYSIALPTEPIKETILASLCPLFSPCPLLAWVVIVFVNIWLVVTQNSGLKSNSIWLIFMTMAIVLGHTLEQPLQPRIWHHILSSCNCVIAACVKITVCCFAGASRQKCLCVSLFQLGDGEMDASSLPGPRPPGRPAHLLLCWGWESQICISFFFFVCFPLFSPFQLLLRSMWKLNKIFRILRNIYNKIFNMFTTVTEKCFAENMKCYILISIFVFVFSILFHFKPSTENYCFASRAKSCSVCLQSDNGCAYCPDEVRRKMTSRSKQRLVLRTSCLFFLTRHFFHLCQWYLASHQVTWIRFYFY